MIKQIKIRDFKSIRELEVNLAPVTVLVGRSGTGKSSFVQALRFLRNFLLNPHLAADFEGGWTRIVPANEKHPKTSIEVLFSVPGEESNYQYRIDFGTQHNHAFNSGIALTLFREQLILGDKPLFIWARNAQGTANWEQKPNLASVPSLSNTAMLGSFPSLQQVVYAFAALSTGIGYYHLPSSVLDSRSEDTKHNNLWKVIPGLWDNAGNFLKTMRSIIQDFNRPGIRKNILASLRAVNPSIASIELDSLTQPTRAIVGHEVSGRILELALEQESDGVRRFYAHLLALYQTPPKLTLIFEEPENAIFPGALRILADEFKAAPSENRGQVILTTHSPGLLDAFSVDDVRVVEMKEGKTVIGPISKEQREAVNSHLLTTGELLTVDQPRIEDPALAEQST